jgi:hypothetical protein
MCGSAGITQKRKNASKKIMMVNDDLKFGEAYKNTSGEYGWTFRILFLLD